MPPIQVKLVSRGDNSITRRLTFPQLPSWTELALKVEGLFNIPLLDVGVAYVDRYVIYPPFIS